MFDIRNIIDWLINPSLSICFLCVESFSARTVAHNKFMVASSYFRFIGTTTKLGNRLFWFFIYQNQSPSIWNVGVLEVVLIQARAPCFSKVYSCFDSFEFLQFSYLMNFQHGPHSLKPGSTTEGLPTLDTRLTCTRFHVKIRVCNSWMHTQNSWFTHHLLAMSQSSRIPYHVSRS